MTDEEPVTAERPETTLNTSGVDHITIWGSNEEDTIEFYRDVLGMPLVLRQPNLDDPDQTHLFFDAGDGRIITFFVSDDRDSSRSPQRGGVGAVHHISFKVSPDRFQDAIDALEEDGRSFNMFDRGIFHSLYTHDNNGLVIELSADKYEVPDEKRGEVLAEAQRKREEDGAEYAQDRHMEQALRELGIEVRKNDLPEADTGVGGI